MIRRVIAAAVLVIVATLLAAAGCSEDRTLEIILCAPGETVAWWDCFYSIKKQGLCCTSVGMEPMLVCAETRGRAAQKVKASHTEAWAWDCDPQPADPPVETGAAAGGVLTGSGAGAGAAAGDYHAGPEHEAGGEI